MLAKWCFRPQAKNHRYLDAMARRSSPAFVLQNALQIDSVEAWIRIVGDHKIVSKADRLERTNVENGSRTHVPIAIPRRGIGVETTIKQRRR
jgi:hypothetical protein